MVSDDPPVPLDLRGGFRIETPEQVSFSLERAGLGSRIAAAAIDTAILVLTYVAVVTGLVFLAGVTSLGAALGGDTESEADLWILGLLVIAATFLVWTYYIGFESVWNGQTPGKRALGLRVVGDGGLPVTFGQVVLRNLVRLADAQLGYAVGLVCVFATRDEKRLGDLAAGTVVVCERRRRSPAALRPGRAIGPGRAVDPDLLALVRDYWAREGEMDPETRDRIAASLAERLSEALGSAAAGAPRGERDLLALTCRVMEVERPAAGRAEG